MATVIKSYVKRITPGEAQTWLNEYAYQFQRNPAKRTVELYARQMSTDAWLDGTTLKLASIRGRKQKMLVDGQHRLLALIASGCPQTFSVVEIDCDDDNDLALLYSTTDRGRQRTVTDMYRTVHLADEVGVTGDTLTRAGSALQFIEDGFDRKGKTKRSYDELLALFRTYADSIGAYVEVAGASPHRSIWNALFRSSTFSLGIVTYQHAVYVYGEKAVNDFWEGVSQDDGLRRTDPRKVANMHLATVRISQASAVNGGGGRIVSAAYSARYLAACWNAWTEERTYSDSTKAPTAKVYDAKAPIKINGTPWKG